MKKYLDVVKQYSKLLIHINSKSNLSKYEFFNLMNFMLTISLNKYVKFLIINPKLDHNQKSNIFLFLLKRKYFLCKSITNFINILSLNNRLFLISEIIKYFFILKNKEYKNIFVNIFSPFKINKNQKNFLTNNLGYKEFFNINLNIIVDKYLIGGICIIIKDRVIDISIRYQLNYMKHIFNK